MMHSLYLSISYKTIDIIFGKRLIALLILLAGFFNQINAQGYSNKGKDFWITYPAHINTTGSAMGIYITSDVSANVNIYVGSKTITYTVTPNAVTPKFLGPNVAGDAPNGPVYLTQLDGIAPNAAIHVVADNPVVVYAHIIYSHRSGASLILPSNVWGRQYIVPSYNNLGTSSGDYGYGTVSIVAKDSNTLVQITPTVDSRTGTRKAYTPYTITLANPGDVYQVESLQNEDISGTIVESISSGTGGCKPIAVFSSTTWSAFGCNGSNSGDNLYQQLFPTGAWGKNFLTSPAFGRSKDIFRMFVKDTSTVVKFKENGVDSIFPKSALLKNSFYEYETGNPIYIQADKPISALQYFKTEKCDGGLIGDPEMIALNPVEQTVNNITVFSAHQNWVPKGQSGVTNCYLNVIINTNGANSFLINGAPPYGRFIVIPGTAYSYLQEDVSQLSATNPVQTLKADSNFTAIAYGFGDVESYGYNAGTNIKDFSQFLTIKNPYASPFNNNTACNNNPFNIGIVLSYQPTSIVWDFNNNPTIIPNTTFTSNNPVADSTFITNGVTQYFYKLPGLYTVKSTASIPLKISVNNPSSDGCSGLQDINYTINITSSTTTSFNIQSTGCINDAVNFTNTSTDNGTSIVEYIWQYNGITSSTINSPSTTYNTAGSFPVTLRNINSLGCYSDTTKTVLITSKPQASFIQVIPACKNKMVQFTDQSSIAAGTLSHWYWDYGNGKKDSLLQSSTVSSVYDSITIDTVRLTVVSSSGCKASTYKLITIHDLPTASFVTPDICLNDAFALFVNNSTITDGTQSLMNYIWQFGDPVSGTGNTSNNFIGNHKYSAVGNYTVQLKVISNNGCVDTATRTFTVNGSIPIANFDILNAGKLCSNDSVIIHNSSTVDFGNITLLKIYWDYANMPAKVMIDSSPVSGKVYRYEYYNFHKPLSQQYSIHFEAYSGITCVSSKDTTITVFASPEISFSIMPKTAICLGDSLILNGMASGITAATISNVLWNFGDKTSDTNWTVIKTYKDSGNYTIRFTGITNNSCRDSAEQKVVIYPVPTVHTVGAMNVLEGASALLSPTYTGHQLSYVWQPATSLNNAFISNPLCTPDSNTLYTITVINNHLCTATDTLFVQVLLMPVIPNVFSPNGDGKHDTWHIEYLNKYPFCTVDVFDRNGQPVFHSYTYDTEWDGTYNGKAVPIGVYYYVIKPNSGREPITGSVTIIR